MQMRQTSTRLKRKGNQWMKMKSSKKSFDSARMTCRMMALIDEQTAECDTPRRPAEKY
jgi:hypothetical protein